MRSNRHAETNKRGSRDRSVVPIAVVLLAVLAGPLCAAALSGGGQAGNTQPQAYNSITIIPASRAIAASSRLPVRQAGITEGTNPEARYAELSVVVQSGLPAWGAVVEALRVRGPDGEVPTDRLYVKTDHTNGRLVPLKEPVLILTGDYKLPVRESVVGFCFAPTWNDRAGLYRASILLRPIVPRGTGGETTLPHETVGIAGTDQEIQVEFENSASIMIQHQYEELQFNVTGEPGAQEATAEIPFTIWSNASEWSVVCEASILDGGKHVIAPKRILWRTLDAGGMLIREGSLAGTCTVLSGRAPTCASDYLLKLVLPITMADVGGTYTARLNLVGIVNERKPEKRIEKELTLPSGGM